MSAFVTRYYRLVLIVILAWSFFTRIYQLHQPEKYIFDEVYHAITAKLIARNDVRAYEWWNPPVEPNTAVDWLHPPLAKYTQAVSILIFGENSFGWRISSVVFGVLLIAAVFKLADVAFASKPLALTAAALTSLDGLILVQSRIAMNDIHVSFFIILTILLYLLYIKKKRRFGFLFATGMSAGLAIASKWSGFFILGLVGIFQGIYLVEMVWQTVHQKKRHWQPLIATGVQSLLVLIILPCVLYLAAYSHMFWQGKSWLHFRELHNQIWWYQTNLKATHGYQSRPWQWFLDTRPVWYYVNYEKSNHIGNIYAFGHPLIFWAGGLASLTTVMWLIYQFWRRRQVSLTLLLLTASYFIVWLPWQLSPRIMFFYHYAPAVPFMCILLAYWLQGVWRKHGQLWVWLYLLMTLGVFIVWYPHWTGIAVPLSFAQSVYFALPSWK